MVRGRQSGGMKGVGIVAAAMPTPGGGPTEAEARAAMEGLSEEQIRALAALAEATEAKDAAEAEDEEEKGWRQVHFILSRSVHFLHPSKETRESTFSHDFSNSQPATGIFGKQKFSMINVMPCQANSAKGGKFEKL